MKILITGMNKAQCTFDFYKKQELKVIQSHYSLIRCLIDMGHEVDQRVVTIGEDLKQYDKIIVYLHNPSGFAGYVYNALWAIYARPDAILAFDDWQTTSITNGILSLIDTNKLFRKFIKDSHKHIPDNIESYGDALLQSIEKIKNYENSLLLTVFSGGDTSLISKHPQNKIFTFNPNPYNFNKKPTIEVTQKERVFNFAGLIQDKTKKWLKNQEITEWPIKMYGSRKDGQDRVVEDEMINIYAQQWGILLPKYDHAGSGWWRLRVLQVTDAGSILIGDPKEMIVYYKDETLASIKASNLITMSDKQLVDFANAQKEAIYKHHPLDKSVQREELEKCIK